jgi:ribosomal protein S18 acetylase RimI-like enzyme
VWREEGPRGLGIRLLGESVYRRAWLLERPLDEPVPAIEPRLPVVIGALGDDECDAYRAFRPETPEAELHRRFRAGDGCFVARHQGRIVCANWWATGSAWNHFLGRTLELEDGEAYVYDSWTLPALRGNALAPALAVALLAHLRAAGYRRVLTVVSPENAANLRARAKSGYRPCGTVGWVGLGPWRRHFRRRRPPRGGPA